MTIVYVKRCTECFSFLDKLLGYMGKKDFGLVVWLGGFSDVGFVARDGYNVRGDGLVESLKLPVDFRDGVGFMFDWGVLIFE